MVSTRRSASPRDASQPGVGTSSANCSTEADSAIRGAESRSSRAARRTGAARDTILISSGTDPHVGSAIGGSATGAAPGADTQDALQSSSTQASAQTLSTQSSNASGQQVGSAGGGLTTGAAPDGGQGALQSSSTQGAPQSSHASGQLAGSADGDSTAGVARPAAGATISDANGENATYELCLEKRVKKSGQAAAEPKLFVVQYTAATRRDELVECLNAIYLMPREDGQSWNTVGIVNVKQPDTVVPLSLVLATPRDFCFKRSQRVFRPIEVDSTPVPEPDPEPSSSVAPAPPASVSSLCRALVGPLLDGVTAAVVFFSMVLLVPVPTEYSPHSLLRQFSQGPAVFASIGDCLLHHAHAECNASSYGAQGDIPQDWLVVVPPELAWACVALVFCVLRCCKHGDCKKAKSEVLRAVETLADVKDRSTKVIIVLVVFVACASGISRAIIVGMAEALSRALTLLQICAGYLVEKVLWQAFSVVSDRAELIAPLLHVGLAKAVVQYKALLKGVLRGLFLHGPEWSLMGTSLGFWNLPMGYDAPQHKELASKVCDRIIFISPSFWLEHWEQCRRTIDAKVEGSASATIELGTIGVLLAAAYLSFRYIAQNAVSKLHEMLLGASNAWLRFPIVLKAFPALPLLLWALDDIRRTLHTVSIALAESVMVSSCLGSAVIAFFLVRAMAKPSCQ